MAAYAGKPNGHNTRKSPKLVIAQYADELLRRNDHDAPKQLLAIEVIALRMNWTELYNKLRYRQRQKPWYTDEKY